ncbi:MAG TPA: DNA repair protein RecN [Thermohalobaculum sp.]|nr:DNA repair protein RecN [Thermohalobaculum sp.]
MLRRLEIRDIVLIETLDLEFGSGLNVLTGETGAGKSILLDALGFALGRTAGRGLVRAGAGQGSVAAEFALPPEHEVFALLEELGFDAGDGGLVLRRTAAEDGPSRAFVNDRRASAEALAQIGERLVEVHGQHDERGLLDQRRHRALLDAWAGLGDERAAVRSAWEARSAAVRALAEAEEQVARAAADADFLRHAVDELERLAPEPGEDEALDAERRLMQAAERIREEVAKAADELSPQAEGALAAALQRLTHVADRAEGRLDGAIEAIDRAMAELAEAERGVAEALEALTFDPARLEAVEERLFALRALARKHRVTPDALPGLAERLAADLAALDAGAERIGALEAEARAAEKAYAAAADALSAARRAGAERLDGAVTAELGPLRMEAARFATRIAEAGPGPEGRDDVAFMATTNPGMPEGPIARIASGGELSRFLLAMKVCLAGRGAGLAMVFDEIDRGVGGATADAVGQRLARLAGDAQVLVVTHSPQVAAKADRHFRIAKSSDGTVTRTDVTPLAESHRLDEIARMLAGERVTDEARSAARVLIGKERP